MSNASLSRPHHRYDTLLKSASAVAASICMGVLALVVLYVTLESLPAVGEIGLMRFVTDRSWHPTDNQFGMMPMIWGTLAASLGSLILAGLLGLGSAVFLRFYAPGPLAVIYRRIIELMAGIPSVVYGLWGIAVLVPLIAQYSPISQGQSLLAGILILTLMTLPTVAMTADAAIGAVPVEYTRGAAAMGLGRRAVAWLVIIPAAKAGILTGLLLQTVRALGETMAVLMICGNIVKTPTSLFDPVRTLTSNIALEMGYADQRHRSILFFSGLVLMITVTGLVLLSRCFTKKRV